MSNQFKHAKFSEIESVIVLSNTNPSALENKKIEFIGGQAMRQAAAYVEFNKSTPAMVNTYYNSDDKFVIAYRWNLGRGGFLLVCVQYSQ